MTQVIHVPLLNLFLALMDPSLMLLLGSYGVCSLGWGQTNKLSFNFSNIFEVKCYT